MTIRPSFDNSSGATRVCKNLSVADAISFSPWWLLLYDFLFDSPFLLEFRFSSFSNFLAEPTYFSWSSLIRGGDFGVDSGSKTSTSIIFLFFWSNSSSSLSVLASLSSSLSVCFSLNEYAFCLSERNFPLQHNMVSSLQQQIPKQSPFFYSIRRVSQTIAGMKIRFTVK